MRLLWIRNLSIAILLATAASHRIISVERLDDQYLWCIVEGSLKETISWEFENQFMLAQNDSTETQKLEIWPEPEFFNLSSGRWDVKNKHDSAFANTSFPPVTDFQWNEFEIVDLKELKNQTRGVKVRQPGTAAQFQFSLLSNASFFIKVNLKCSQLDFEIRIDSTNISLVDEKNITTYYTFLRRESSSIDLSFASNDVKHGPELENGVRWKSYNFFTNHTTMQLTSEGRTLIDYTIVKNETELFSRIDFKTTGKALLKLHNYTLAVVACEESKAIHGTWTLDAKKRGCIEVTYFSRSSPLTLTMNKNTIILSAADNWKTEKLWSKDIPPSGNYTFEIKRNECTESVSVIRSIRFCNENEFFVYKIDKKYVANTKESNCHTLASKKSQTLLQKADTELKPVDVLSSNLTSFLELEFKKQEQKKSSNSAIVCVSNFGCFCWAGWKGATCTEACQPDEYGMNCMGVCGDCKRAIECDKLNGHCLQGCKYSSATAPLCIDSVPHAASSIPVLSIIVPLLVAATVVLMYAIKKCRPYRVVTLSNQRMDRIPSVRYGELQYSGSRMYTKETFSSRFQDAFQSGQLERDYESLPRGQLNSWDVGTNAQNLLKNRYIEIAAYDFNRVILGGASNYINASYIKDHQNRNVYIAAQGPKSETLNDFWRMIWQERVSTVVMLGPIVDNEMVMCQQYWPPLGCKMMIGDFSISCNAEKKYIGFMKRTLSFTRPPGGSRQVIQLHYSEWTRNALPSDLSTLAIFMEIIQCKRQTPILVHCSGGTGRTCTIILVDQCIRKLNLDNKVDVFKTMDSMRRERINAVENFDQYVLAHKLIMQYFQLGPTRL